MYCKLHTVIDTFCQIRCRQGCVAVYPPGRADGVEVRGSDLARLEPDEFLNDTVIDLYIRCAAWGGGLLLSFEDVGESWLC